ncbi:hypothetical protein [Nocardia sp. NBC_00403]|uniref:hypothetical protein n=1 Tax=Nocardia sp. NBC_00403 TaxID=2975990 RepID=UPI002E1F162E
MRYNRRPSSPCQLNAGRISPISCFATTAKDFEVPIQKLFQGADPAHVVERSAVDDPDLLDWYAALR